MTSATAPFTSRQNPPLPDHWDQLFSAVLSDALDTAGVFVENRARQQVYWMERAIEAGLLERFHADPAVASQRAAVAAEVREGRLSPDHAAARLLALFIG